MLCNENNQWKCTIDTCNGNVAGLFEFRLPNDENLLLEIQGVAKVLRITTFIPVIVPVMK